ncbi:MAG: RluA family pseudouridine synthase [Anaeroplasmataceae bacterium]
MINKYIIDDSLKGIRLDKALKSLNNDMSRTLLSNLIASGNVKVNNKVSKPSYITNLGDEITVEIEEAKETTLEAQNLNLNIVYEDNDVAVVDKPTGLVVHPAAGNKDNTLVNGLLYELDDFSGIKGEIRPGIVHRIDKDTSGLLMIAKNDMAMENLSEQLKNHTVNRLYVGLACGVIEEAKGRIDAPIGRDPSDRKKMAVVKDGKKAITNFRVLERYKKFTLVEFKLETGRTHQIRVHMKYIGHPLVGDIQYGPKKLISETGQYLHAKTLGFIHPTTKEYMEFNSELPSYFKEYLATLEK